MSPASNYRTATRTSVSRIETDAFEVDEAQASPVTPPSLPQVARQGEARIGRDCAREPFQSARYKSSVAISRAVPNIRTDRPAATRDFFVELLGFEVAMDLGWVVTVASPRTPSVQITIVGGDDMAAPGITVEVADVDAVHAKAVERGFHIAYPLRNEEWGVRRFMLREPSGTVVNVLSHLPEERQDPPPTPAA
jgi:catechol 2,3-dioxygenase-like lactoylglutathione lyase family enzyme